MKQSRQSNRRTVFAALLLGFVALAYAGTGDLFRVTSTGPVETLSFQLCLNAQTPWSCETHTATHQNIDIQTVTPNHTYPAAGIKVLTPGHTLTGCTLSGSGYCQFSVSDTNKAHIEVKSAVAMTTLAANNSSLALSVQDGAADPALEGKPRKINISNTGQTAAHNVHVTHATFPDDTSISATTCTGTLNAGASCEITITPGETASSDIDGDACTEVPGKEPAPTKVTVSADNAPATDINVLILGYGCIYQGGFLFSVDDETPEANSIGGKVAALLDEDGTFAWGPDNVLTGADDINNGLENTNILKELENVFPAAQACFNKVDKGFNDWYLPAICEMGVGSEGVPACDENKPNLRTMLFQQDLGDFEENFYWSSTEVDEGNARMQVFSTGDQPLTTKILLRFVRCVRAFTP